MSVITCERCSSVVLIDAEVGLTFTTYLSFSINSYSSANISGSLQTILGINSTPSASLKPTTVAS